MSDKYLSKVMSEYGELREQIKALEKKYESIINSRSVWLTSIKTEFAELRERDYNTTITGVETHCLKCNTRLNYHFRCGHELISEFVKNLNNVEMTRMEILKMWEERLPDAMP